MGRERRLAGAGRSTTSALKLWTRPERLRSPPGRARADNPPLTLSEFLNRAEENLGFSASGKSPSFGRFAAQTPARSRFRRHAPRFRPLTKVACPDESRRRSRRSRDSGNRPFRYVLVGPYRRQGGDARPLHRFALVLDDHFRQDPPVPQVQNRDGEFRADLLVGPIARRALHFALEPAEQLRRGGAVCGGDAGMEALIPAGRGFISGPPRAHRQGARRLDRARGRAARVRTFWFWRPSPRPGRSSACSARCSAS